MEGRQCHSKNRQAPYIKNQSESSTISGILLPEGLPNIGNTCFLNSVLQQLYRIHPLNQFISQSKDRSGLMSVLKQLFGLMPMQKWNFNKKQALTKLLSKLKSILPRYQIGRQYDSFETLLAFLNYLFDKMKDLKRLFQVSFNYSCQCQDKVFQFQTITIQLDVSCCDCQKIINIQYTVLPQFLIVRFQNQRNQNFSLKLKSGQQVQYQLESKNIYIGSGESGHYYAECRYQGLPYIYNDISVQQKSDKNFGSCLFAIYKKSTNQNKPKYSNTRPYNWSSKLEVKCNLKPLNLLNNLAGIEKYTPQFDHYFNPTRSCSSVQNEQKADKTAKDNNQEKHYYIRSSNQCVNNPFNQSQYICKRRHMRSIQNNESKGNSNSGGLIPATKASSNFLLSQKKDAQYTHQAKKNVESAFGEGNYDIFCQSL